MTSMNALILAAKYVLNMETDQEVLHNMYSRVVQTLVDNTSDEISKFAREQLNPDESKLGRALGCAFVGTTNPNRMHIFSECITQMLSGKLEHTIIVPVDFVSLFLTTLIEIGTEDINS